MQMRRLSDINELAVLFWYKKKKGYLNKVFINWYRVKTDTQWDLRILLEKIESQVTLN